MSSDHDSEEHTLEGLLDLVVRAAGGDQDALSDCAFYFMMVCCEAGISTFPDALFNLIVTTMQDPVFLANEDAWKVLTILTSDWDMVTEDQRHRLLPAIEEAYTRFQHWMNVFNLSEILGDSYCDERAFKVVDRLYKLSSDMPRQFLPHVLEHLAKDAADQSLRDRALEKLRRIAATDSGATKREAQDSLAKLGHQQERN